MPTRPRKPGEFCWINVLTPDPAAARTFFTKLLGWSYADMGGMGDLIEVQGQNIGGLFDLKGPNVPPGTPPCIGVMIKVDDADATAAKVQALGGKAMPPFDVMDNGRMAVCFDPNGAPFDVWQPKRQGGTEVDSTLQGAPSWFESLTSDVPRAVRFYQDLFGWTAEAMEMPDFTYTVFKLGTDYAAGMMAAPPNMGPIPPHWGTYFTVDDVDARSQLATELGGKVQIGPMDIPGVGRFAGITSPQGVMFYIIKYLPMQQ